MSLIYVIAIMYGRRSLFWSITKEMDWLIRGGWCLSLFRGLIGCLLAGVMFLSHLLWNLWCLFGSRCISTLALCLWLCLFTRCHAGIRAISYYCFICGEVARILCIILLIRMLHEGSLNKAYHLYWGKPMFILSSSVQNHSPFRLLYYSWFNLDFMKYVWSDAGLRMLHKLIQLFDSLLPCIIWFHCVLGNDIRTTKEI